MTTRLAWLASEFFQTSLLLATVRAEHQAFYRRVFGHRLICDATALSLARQADQPDGARLRSWPASACRNAIPSSAPPSSSAGCCLPARRPRLRRLAHGGLTVGSARRRPPSGSARRAANRQKSIAYPAVLPQARRERGRTHAPRNAQSREEWHMSADGTWKLSMQTPIGERKSTLALNSAGGALTGKLTADEGTPPTSSTARPAATTSPSRRPSRARCP